MTKNLDPVHWFGYSIAELEEKIAQIPTDSRAFNGCDRGFYRNVFAWLLLTVNEVGANVNDAVKGFTPEQIEVIAGHVSELSREWKAAEVSLLDAINWRYMEDTVKGFTVWRDLESNQFVSEPVDGSVMKDRIHRSRSNGLTLLGDEGEDNGYVPAISLPIGYSRKDEKTGKATHQEIMIDLSFLAIARADRKGYRPPALLEQNGKIMIAIKGTLRALRELSEAMYEVGYTLGITSPKPDPAPASFQIESTPDTQHLIGMFS